MESREPCATADWVRLFRRDSELLIVAQVAQGRARYQETLNVDFNPRCLKHEEAFYHIDRADLAQESTAVKNSTEEHPSFLRALAGSLEEDGEKLLRKTQSLAEDVDELDRGEIAERFAAYDDIFLQYRPYVWVVFAIERLIAERLKAQVAKERGDLSGRAVEDFITELTALPFEKSTAVAAQERILGAARLVKESSSRASAIDELSQELHSEYSWTGAMRVGWTYLRGEYDVGHFRALLDALSQGDPARQLSILLENQAKVPEKHTEFILTQKPSDELLEIAELVRRFAFLRTRRGEFVVQAMLNGRILLDRIATLLQNPIEDVVYCLPREILDALEGRPLPDGYNARRRGFKMIIEGDMTHVEPEEYGLDVAPLGVHGIRGQGIVPGVVKGKVRIVHSLTEASTFEDGEILVTQMTSPDMMPAMVRAAAIVTDEGGLTCHAALIARELGVPCVIGTEIATRVFCSGDRVEVDSREGCVAFLDRES